MKNLIKAEFYKLRKRKVFQFILILNCVTILYALGMYFEWGWIELQGKFDLINYSFGMWHLFFIMGIPLIAFMYIGANLVGTEISGGQIILEVTRVADKRKVIYSKFIAMLIIIVFYFISNITLSILSYIFIVSKTQYATNSMLVIDTKNVHLIITSMGVLLYLILSTFFSMCISVKKKAIFSTVLGLVVYFILSLAIRVPNLQYWIPGYFALAPDINLNSYFVVTIYQIIVSLIIIALSVFIADKQFKKLDL
ncbi:ABC transporter permease [Paraclostridium bifermentans]|uniref:ABC transporter permease n=1 Tax=Paraclostridium bifermentans TaxID=1490 RepID=UPI00189AE14E|nr:ABC transporter permease [Paraclostridium bifermentans]